MTQVPDDDRFLYELRFAKRTGENYRLVPPLPAVHYYICMV